MEDSINDEVYEHLMEWLSEQGRTVGDIMMEYNVYFIYTEDENGTPGDDGYKITTRKVVLPEQFQALTL